MVAWRKTGGTGSETRLGVLIQFEGKEMRDKQQIGCRE